MKHTVPEANSATLTALVRTWAEVSNRKARELIEAGGVRIGGRVCRDPVSRPQGGEVVEIADAAPAGPRPRRAITGPGFRVLHQDRSLLVVDKAPGVVVVPTGKEDPDDLPLVARVAAALKLAGHRGDPLWVIHRIDRSTSGLVLMARNEKAAETLREQFHRREPRREYLAWVAGHPDPPFARLECSLAEDPHTHRVEVTPSPTLGRQAVLDYAVQATSDSPDGPAARVLVHLVTGRRNQVRALFSHFGWPLLGDGWYGGPKQAITRTALHAWRLEIVHPETRQKELFTAPLPDDLTRLDRRLRLRQG
ncbi:MAG: RluA family pseudouridine synthase [Acidobacteriota bacterium]|nr:RluA family pseudouridine synthase [Acidobacteriota bacterium]